MTQGEADLIVGTGAQTDASGRWGDYSMMAVDPDNCTFWYTQEYYAATSGAGWRTRIGSFSFPSCTGTPPPPPPPALPSVSVVATTTPAREAGQTSGVFTVTRTGDTAAPMTVQYSVGGTATPGSDYAALPGSLTIPAGASSATIIVAPIDDLLVEPDESVIVTLVSTADYRVGSPGVATVTIVSDDKPPDLVVSSLTAPSNGGAGAALTVNDTTSNQGTGPAPASLTAFYLSLDFTIDSKDILLGTRSVPMLAAGASNSAATTFTVPAGTATGTYWLLATADSGNAVPETSEANNTKAAGPVGIGPDLLVSTMSGPAAAAAGTAIVVTDTTLNQGGAAVDSSRTDFYLSSSGNLDATAVAIGSRLVPALAAGGSSSASTSLTVPGTTAPGTYFVLGKADGAGAIVETNESNNVKNGVVIRIGPDLIVTSVTVPASGGAGGVLAVTDTTKNQGAATAAPSTTFFYLSADVSLDPSDVLLGGRAVPALAPGASDTASTSLPIPASTATGAYFVIAMADGGKVVAESIEINNTSTATVRIGPDLTVPSLSVPAVGGAGSAIVVTDTTMNAGGGAAAGSTTAFYLSTNSIVDSSDILLGTRTIQPLSAGASDSASTTLTIPPSTPTGTYVILALADSANVVVESSEVNNTSAGAIIRIGPDLTVTTVSGPGTASAGSTIVVTDTTQNAGGGAAPASTTQFYLSANLGVDSADFLIGSRAVPPLAAGASDTASTTVTLPAGIAPGYYFILAVSDGPGVIVETSEINNVRAVFNQIVP
jgi:subtilase family serine protease